MHVDQRQERLLEVVRQAGRIRVADLADELAVSVVTVRRDVEALAAAGRLRRLHGSVAFPSSGEPGSSREPGEDSAGAEQTGPVVGMVVPMAQYYFGDIVRGAQAVVEAAGARLVLAITQYRDEMAQAHTTRLLDAGVDGLLLTPGWSGGNPEPAQEEWLARLPVPTVLVERQVAASSPAALLDRVRSADVVGGALAVRYLGGLGHERIALLHQPGQHAVQVRSGFTEAIGALGLWRPRGEPGLILSDADLDSEAVVSWLADAYARDKITAILVFNDELAIRVLAGLQARGLHVPDDISIVAYDDEVAELAEVPLTAVAPPKREVGRNAAELLLHRIAERSSGIVAAAPHHLDLLPSLRVRVSTAAPEGLGERTNR